MRAPVKLTHDRHPPIQPCDAERIVGNPEVIPPIFRKILAAAVGRTGRSVSVLFQFADPDVAVAHRMIMVLQGEREFFRSGGVRRAHVVAGGAGQLDEWFAPQYNCRFARDPGAIRKSRSTSQLPGTNPSV
jgi:hypothetical protein